MSGQKGKVHLGPNVSSSAHYRGCVVNGSGAIYGSNMIIIIIIIIIIMLIYYINNTIAKYNCIINKLYNL